VAHIRKNIKNQAQTKTCHTSTMLRKNETSHTWDIDSWTWL